MSDEKWEKDFKVESLNENEKKEEIAQALQESEKLDELIKREQEMPEIDKIKQELGKAYETTIEILKKYCDLREDYYPLVALWIIGTYMHKEFKSYPYLYINAMRGSGKTRLLELISILSNNGQLLSSLKEAVLFRTASNSTFCIDEFERISGREKAELRELLNSAYKRGMKVKRMKKVKEEQQVEEFSVYCPIAIANIWGMEEVLGDRCIPLILEKSNIHQIIKKVEDFEDNLDIKSVKKAFQCSLCSVVYIKTIYRDWNKYIDKKYTNYTNDTNYTKNTTTNYTLHTLHTTTQTTLQLQELFNKIDNKNISGRHLELFFPLFIIANFLNEDVLSEILEIAEKIVNERKTEERTESKDIMLIKFLSDREYFDFTPVREITKDFKEYLKEDDEDSKYTNTRWVGRALKRLNLIIEKRRTSAGIEVIVNLEKAKDKIKMFK